MAEITTEGRGWQVIEVADGAGYYVCIGPFGKDSVEVMEAVNEAIANPDASVSDHTREREKDSGIPIRTIFESEDCGIIETPSTKGGKCYFTWLVPFANEERAMTELMLAIGEDVTPETQNTKEVPEEG